MTQQQELLRVTDIAPLLGVSASRVHQLVRLGAIPSTRVGGSVRIPRAAWEQWLSDQRDKALAAVKQA